MERVMASNRHWLHPPTVKAPSPYNRSEVITFAISDIYLKTLFGGKRVTPIYQIWTHVVGELPPINNVSRLLNVDVVPTLTTLQHSIACFRGVQRPYDDEEDGGSVLVYVLNPKVSIARDVNMACLAKAVRVPAETCLTVQVKPTAALQPPKMALNSDVTRYFDTEDEETVHGVVTRLEFIPGTGDSPTLPERHDERYHQRLW
jgi:hypothetical protein